MSSFAEIAKEFYDDGIWSKDDLKSFVKACELTADEYEIITGEKYKGGK